MLSFTVAGQFPVRTEFPFHPVIETGHQRLTYNEPLRIYGSAYALSSRFATFLWLMELCLALRTNAMGDINLRVR
jgi:hypothetical protein